MRQERTVWVVVMVAALFGGAACGGGSSAPEQLGEACSDVGDAFCERAVECGFIGSNEQLGCVNVFFDGCCGDDGTCNSPVDETITDAEWDRCLDGFATESCADIEEGNVPAACLSL